jgi:hypothetical protein
MEGTVCSAVWDAWWRGRRDAQPIDFASPPALNQTLLPDGAKVSAC